MRKLKTPKSIALAATLVMVGAWQVQAETPAVNQGNASISADAAAQKPAENIALATGEEAAQVPGVSATPPTNTPETIPPATVSPSDTPSVNTAEEKATLEKRKAEIASKVRNPTLRGHLMDNIDIFGKNDLPAIYILGPGIEEFEGQLLTRDFARDPFFMQNIDREEFEMKMWLHGDFEEDRKKKNEESK